jgi:hypothetical protein
LYSINCAIPRQQGAFLFDRPVNWGSAKLDRGWNVVSLNYPYANFIFNLLVSVGDCLDDYFGFLWLMGSPEIYIGT